MEMTYALIIAQRQQEAHEREFQAKAWSVEVTERLANEQSKFMNDFDDNEKRIFGLIQDAR